MDINRIKEILNARFKGKNVIIRVQDPHYYEEESQRDVKMFYGVVESFEQFVCKTQHVKEYCFMDGSSKRFDTSISERSGICFKMNGGKDFDIGFEVHIDSLKSLDIDESKDEFIVYDSSYQIPSVAVLKVEYYGN